MSNMKENVVIITGAVGNLGAAAAQAFREVGAKTVLVDRSPDRLEKAYPELSTSADHFLAGGVDVGDGSALERLAQQVVERFGRIDTLVNTVGSFRGGKSVYEEPLETWDFLLKVNLMTTLNSCRAVIPHMLKRQRGKIVNTSSLNAYAGGAGLGAYSASKSAVLRLTESLAGELKASGITVNAVLPGTMDTPQNRKAMPGEDYSKWVQPAAVAEVIVFLASDSARSVNGVAVPATGKA